MNSEVSKNLIREEEFLGTILFEEVLRMIPSIRYTIRFKSLISERIRPSHS
jgi:hypothetical protein